MAEIIQVGLMDITSAKINMHQYSINEIREVYNQKYSQLSCIHSEFDILRIIILHGTRRL